MPWRSGSPQGVFSASAGATEPGVWAEAGAKMVVLPAVAAMAIIINELGNLLRMTSSLGLQLCRCDFPL
jgi:hypothetical protein